MKTDENIRALKIIFYPIVSVFLLGLIMSYVFNIPIVNKKAQVNIDDIQNIIEEAKEGNLALDEITPVIKEVIQEYTGSMFIREEGSCDLLYSGEYKTLLIKKEFTTPSLSTLRDTNGYLKYSEKFDIPKDIKEAWLCIESDFNDIGNSKKNYATTYFFIGDRKNGGHINVSNSEEYGTLYGEGRFWPNASSRYPKGPQIYFENLNNIKVYNSTLGNVSISPVDYLKKGGDIRIGAFVNNQYEGGVVKVFKIFYK